MFKNLLSAVTIAVACSLCSNANAQTDTSYYDLGRMRIKKNFAQSVTIKAEDLEKIPATNLSDALTVWLSGAYTSTNSVAYVIDGDLINDVNAYSIFDIDQVTLIQNASAVINGAEQLLSLVLIKTRNNRPERSGLMVNGQSNLIGLHNDPGLKKGSDANFYHQYYISAYKNTDVMHVGLSADYQHDAIDEQSITATSLTTGKATSDRFKFYGFFDHQIGSNSVLNVSVNYVPQTENNSTTNSVYNTAGPNALSHAEETKIGLLNTKLALSSNLTDKLNNQLSFNYNNTTSSDNTTIKNASSNYPQLFWQRTTTNAFLLRDNLTYAYNRGDWDIEPALNFNFSYAKQSASNTISLPGGAPISLYDDDKSYFLTPSVNAGYKNIFYVQGGVMFNLTPNAEKKALPFITSSIDILRLTAADESYSWKIFGSYVASGPYYSIKMLDQTTQYYWNNSLVNTDRLFNNFQAGTMVSFLHNRLSFDYNYQNWQFTIPEVIYINNGSIQVIFPVVNSNLNRLGVTAKVINTSSAKWSTNLNVTKINNSYDLSQTGVLFTIPEKKGGWSGGWVNKVEIGKLTLGADMLYLVHQSSPVISFNNTTTYNNSFVLQNAYIGYRIQTKTFKTLDIYANARNPVQNTASDITDNRKFYGLGFKAGF